MVQKPSIMCANCDLNPICFSAIAKQHKICRQPVAKGETLVLPDQEVHQVYLVYIGAFKCEIADHTGKTHIARFFMPGDIIGLETLDNKKSLGKITALEQSAICKLDTKLITEYCQQDPQSHCQMIHLISRSMRKLYTQHHQYDSAEKALVSFLLDIYALDQDRGNRSNSFRLPMTKKDMANYLHLTPETISRILTKLKHDMLLETQGKKINVLDQRGLMNILH